MECNGLARATPAELRHRLSHGSLALPDEVECAHMVMDLHPTSDCVGLPHGFEAVVEPLAHAGRRLSRQSWRRATMLCVSFG